MAKQPQAEQTTLATQQTALLDPQLDFGSDAGAGMEGTDKESFAIPFLTVLQQLSPQVDESDAKYIEGAKVGMLLNTVTGRLYDGREGLVVLPAAYQRRFLRWGPRGTENSGFKGELFPEQVARMRERGEITELDGRLYAPLGDGTVSDKRCDRFSDTRNHFCVIEATGEQVLLSLSSTQIKKSKALMAMLSSVKVPRADGLAFTPPTWANRVRVTTCPEANDKGKWHGVRFALEGFTTSAAAYAAGKAFHAALAAGTAGEVRYEDAAEESREDTDDRF